MKRSEYKHSSGFVPDYYRDTGCSIAPSCLNCPLPRCRYDVQGGARSMRLAVRDPLIKAAYQSGEPIEVIARRHNVSRRTVHRVVA